MTLTLHASRALEPCLKLLGEGEPVAVPTETVYGLAADATNNHAVEQIYAIKGRPAHNPLICHVSSLEMASSIAVLQDEARRLAKQFWPGALTLVLPALHPSRISSNVLAGLSTIAIRQPVGFLADLIGAFGHPLAAPSANLSGRISATTAQAVAADLDGKVALVVDNGPTPIGVESTIVKLEEDKAVLLRPGGIATADIEAILGYKLADPTSSNKVEAPGMLSSHYAPNARLRLNAMRVQAGEALLAFGNAEFDRSLAETCLNLSPTADLDEAARNLFTYLRKLDETGAQIIAVEPIPTGGLGDAVIDRLVRAAVPRD